MLLISILSVAVGMILVSLRLGPNLSQPPALVRLGDWLILGGVLALVTFGELAKALHLA